MVCQWWGEIVSTYLKSALNSWENALKPPGTWKVLLHHMMYLSSVGRHCKFKFGSGVTANMFVYEGVIIEGAKLVQQKKE